jgi:hypothetical protein
MCVAPYSVRGTVAPDAPSVTGTARPPAATPPLSLVDCATAFATTNSAVLWEAVQGLIDAIRDSPEAIDAWIDAVSQRFEVVHDRV